MSFQLVGWKYFQTIVLIIVKAGKSLKHLTLFLTGNDKKCHIFKKALKPLEVSNFHLKFDLNFISFHQEI